MAADDDPVLKMGYLTKSSGTRNLFNGGWDTRWFVLSLKAIKYFANEKAYNKNKPVKGIIPLTFVMRVEETSNLKAIKKDKAAFDVVTSDRVFVLFASTRLESNEWMTAIRESFEREAKNKMLHKSVGLSPEVQRKYSGMVAGEKAGTPIIDAIRANSIGDMRAALDGCDPDYERAEEGLAPMHVAAHSGRDRFIALLLDAGGDPDVYDNQHTTPLYFAADAGHTEVAILLIEAGADPNVQREPSKSTPLHCAARRGHLTLCNLLMDNGAVVDALRETKATPLHYAAYGGFNDVVEALLNRGASPLAVTATRASVLHMAARRGHHSTVMMLLDAGANPNVRDDEGAIPMDVALEKGYSDVANLLKMSREALAHEANLTRKDVARWTELDVGMWLRQNDLGVCAADFEKNSINGVALLRLTADDAYKLGMNVGQVKNLMLARDELQNMMVMGYANEGEYVAAQNMRTVGAGGGQRYSNVPSTHPPTPTQSVRFTAQQDLATMMGPSPFGSMTSANGSAVPVPPPRVHGGAPLPHVATELEIAGTPPITVTSTTSSSGPTSQRRGLNGPPTPAYSGNNADLDTLNTLTTFDQTPTRAAAGRDDLATVQTESGDSVRYSKGKGQANVVVNVGGGLEAVEFSELEDVEELGEGGYGKVYKCKRPGNSFTYYALKLVEKKGVSTSSFVAELQLAASLRDANIVQYIAVVQNPLGMLMEYMDKGDLSSLLEQNPPLLTIQLRVSILFDVARGIGFLHSTNTPHRDIKPANVLLTSNAYTAKISDFGLSGAASYKTMGVGTLRYAAPEVLEGGSGDLASDIYSFGVLMYEVLTGKQPFAGPAEKRRKNLVAPPGDTADIPFPELASVVARMLLCPGSLRPTIGDVLLAINKLKTEMEDDTAKMPRRMVIPSSSAAASDALATGR